LWTRNVDGLNNPEIFRNIHQSTTKLKAHQWNVLLYFLWTCSNSRWGIKSGISKNSVKKTVRESVAEILSDERSEEFIESNRFEKVFSCFVEAGSFFASFFAEKKEDPRRGNDKKRVLILAATYSPTREPCSTIGDSELNFCVRDGNRCGLTSITTSINTLVCSISELIRVKKLRQEAIRVISITRLSTLLRLHL
jgi:hypothetical protein